MRNVRSDGPAEAGGLVEPGCARERHTTPKATSSFEGRLGVSRESGNLGPGAPAVNAKHRKNRGLRRRPGSISQDATTSPGNEKYLAGLKFTGWSMERETGFEPATLGLEGRCSSR